MSFLFSGLLVFFSKPVFYFSTVFVRKNIFQVASDLNPPVHQLIPDMVHFTDPADIMTLPNQHVLQSHLCPECGKPKDSPCETCLLEAKVIM